MVNICKFCGRKMILDKIDENGHRTWKCPKGCSNSPKTSHFKAHSLIILMGLIVLYTLFLVGNVNAISVSDCGKGGTISIDGDYCVHSFYTNGTFNLTTSFDAQILIVAGGGAGTGGIGGGGGAGGLIYNSSYYLVSGTNYNVTVGTGGIRGADESTTSGKGSNSSFASLQAKGGGNGGGVASGSDGGSGGSGGGGGVNSGIGLIGQGNNGGNHTGGFNVGGGGGGAGAVGVTATGNTGGNGGVGIQYAINGSNVYYAGGGGGACYSGASAFGTGGLGGGGNGNGCGGGLNGASGINATGGGGGGGAGGGGLGGNGGNGVVVVRYKAGGITITNSIPSTNANLTKGNLTFGCNLTTIGTVNINSVILNVSGSSNFTQTISGLNTPNYNATFINSTLGNGNYNWNCIGIGDVSNGTSSIWSFYMNDIIFNSQTYNPTTIEGNNENFTLNFTISNSNVLNSVYFYYNNTQYYPSITRDGTNFIATENLIIPAVQANSNNNFFWNVNTVYSSMNTTGINQTVLNINVDDCSTYTLRILNLTMLDEETQTILPSINTTIEVNVNIYPVGSTNSIVNFSKSYTNTNNASVCLNAGSLNNSQYYLDAQIRYSATNYVTKLYNIQHYSLTNTTALQNINLYNLLITLNTDFLITIKDSSFLSVKNALIMIQRFYVGDGVYRNVEIPLTDNIGQAIGHFNTNSVIYRITIVKDGVTLMVFNGVTIVCTDKTLGQCYLNLNQPSSSSGFSNMNTFNNLNYNLSFNPISRAVLVYFNTLDGSIASMFLNTTAYGTGTLLCSNSLISSAGSFSCIVPDSYGNGTMVAELSNYGQLIARGIFSIPNSPIQAGSSDALFFVIVLLVSIPMLFITDKRFLLVGVLLVFVIAMGLGIYLQTSWLGVTSAISWLIIALVIIIWKLSLRNREGIE